MKERSLEKHSVFALSLLFSFCIVFGIASIVAYDSYTKAIEVAIRSNEARANLLAKLILEYQRAAIGVLRSYASRPSLVISVKRKDFEGALRHLTDLTKNNPEAEWPFIANPDSTVWVNFPVDKRVYNRDLSSRDWYKGIKKEWKPYVSRVFKLIVGEKDLGVAVCVPIFDEKGQTIGILSTAQSTAFFRKIIEEVSLNPDAKITLIDREGHIIYSNRFPYTKEVIDYPSLDFVRRAMKGERGDIEIRDSSDGGRMKYVSFEPVKGIGWSIIVEKAKSEVLRSEYFRFVLIVAISFLICVVVVLSLVHLREKQRKLVKLAKLNTELEERVRQRTSELEAKNQSLNSEITERKQSEEELKKYRGHLEEIVEARASALMEMERIFRELYEGSRDGYVLVDMEGYIKEFNHAYQQILGYSKEELYKLTYEDLTPAKWHEMEAQILKEQILPRGVSDIYEKEYTKKDRTVFPVELRTYLIRDKNGMPSGMWAFIRDITERKRVEEKIQTLNKELEQRLGELTAVNKEMETFSYSVSHDLRAPLRSIDGFSLALLEDHADQLDKKGKDYFRRIRSATQRMSELIDGLLILSRLTRMEMKRETVDLSEMTKHLSVELQNGQPDRPVEFVIAEGATAQGDAVMLRVVLQNLMGNAWKFTQEHPTARIEFGVMEGDGQEATDKRQTIFYVRDDGAGFDMAYSDNLFAAFQRLHSNVDFPGIGIGLTTVQRIIHRHGGRIWAEGEVEKGATFFFTLP